ncbi:MAG: histidinol-phosphate transaminase [Gammaproteobacteria bacterium]|nr:histidinol-phosphate transaminase [Gammaproteobacteria bacterium]
MSENRVRHNQPGIAQPTGPQPLPWMQTFTPYVQGKCKIEGQEEVIKLSSNECCFGPSPAAVDAYHGIALELHRYPDGSQAALRQAIASVHGIDADRIVCGNGSEEVIGLLIRCYVGEGDELLLSENHFVMCSIYGKGQGADIVLAPETNYTIDVDAILERVSDRTRMIAIANPNNPTGTYLPASEIRRLIESVPENILIILDGAYAEFVEADDFDAGIQSVESRNNVVMTRTFSKIYGLAGLRIGWGYGPPAVIEIVNRLRTPFNASIAALAAAEAAIGDHAHVERVREHNTHWLTRFREEFTNLGLTVVPSVANFYLMDYGGLPDKSAEEAGAYLEAHGIIPRPGGSDKCLRITVGNEAENEAVLETLSAYLTS